MNEAIFSAINSLAGSFPALDGLMIFFSRFSLPIMIVVGFIVLYKLGKSIISGFLLTIALVILIDFLINLILPTQRPFVVEYVKLLNPHEPDPSFPSLHAALAGAAAVYVFLYHRLVGIVLVAAAFLTGISRIFVGVHWPVDVLGGFLIGGTCAYLVKLILDRIKLPSPKLN